jgi:adenylate cyclase
VRVKSFQDTIRDQAAQLEELNRDLEGRVRAQVGELERLGRMRRFLSPRLAEVLVSAEGEALLESHRRQIAVLSCQLRGFAVFAETTAPEEGVECAARVPRRGQPGVGAG